MDLRASSTPAEPPAVPAPTPRRKERASSCVLPQASCIANKSIDEARRKAVLEAFAEAQIKLCAGDRVLLDLEGRETVVVDAPQRIDKDDLLLLRAALRTRLSQSSNRLSVEIRCKR